MTVDNSEKPTPRYFHFPRIMKYHSLISGVISGEDWGLNLNVDNSEKPTPRYFHFPCIMKYHNLHIYHQDNTVVDSLLKSNDIIINFYINLFYTN